MPKRQAWWCLYGYMSLCTSVPQHDHFPFSPELLNLNSWLNDASVVAIAQAWGQRSEKGVLKGTLDEDGVSTAKIDVGKVRVWMSLGARSSIYGYILMPASPCNVIKAKSSRPRSNTPLSLDLHLFSFSFPLVFLCLFLSAFSPVDLESIYLAIEQRLDLSIEQRICIYSSYF